MIALALLLLAAAPDAPRARAEDRHRFPYSHAEAERHAAFANAHLDWAAGPPETVRTRWGVDLTVRRGGKAMSPEYIRDVTWRRDCWQALRTGDMDELRQQLGHEAFYAGVMPDPVPWWLFRDRE